MLVSDQGDRDPYWCRLWPSAVALAQLILQQPGLVKGKRVCDIGCGLGLAGIAAALAGEHTPSTFPSPPFASLLSSSAAKFESICLSRLSQTGTVSSAGSCTTQQGIVLHKKNSKYMTRPKCWLLLHNTICFWLPTRQMPNWWTICHLSTTVMAGLYTSPCNVSWHSQSWQQCIYIGGLGHLDSRHLGHNLDQGAVAC